MEVKDVSRRRFLVQSAAWSAAGVIHPYAYALYGGVAGDAARMAAVAAWVKEDADAAERVGLRAEAEVQRAELASMEAMLSGTPAPQHTGLFPRVVTTKENPWLYATLIRVDQLAKEGKTYPRGADADHKDLGIRYAYPYIRIATEGVLLAHAFGHRQSPFYGDPALIAPILRRFRASYEILTPSSKHLMDFGVSPHMSEMFCLFHSAFPSLLPASIQQAFSGAVRRNAEAILDSKTNQIALPGTPDTTYEQIFLHPLRGNCYPNAYSHYMNALLFSGIALKDDRMLAAARSAVDLMGTAIYADGGTAYIGFQNECFTYHPIMINDLVRYGQVTGDGRASQFAKASRWYYPLAITPQAVAEYSSAPCWKHYWNAIKGTDAAAILSSLCDCGYNALVGENDKASAGWLAATVWKPVSKAVWWDDAITYDASLQGVRGRYGNYSFCATTRNTVTDSRGKSTYVGSLLVDSKSSDHLKAALDSVWGELALKAQPDLRNGGNTPGDRFHGQAACLVRDETTAYTVTPNFGAVSSLYRLAEYGRPPIPVAGRQMWLLTPERIVGRIEVECLQDIQGFGLGLGVKMIAGRPNSGIKQDWKQKGDVFGYSDYTLRLWPSGGKGDLLLSPNRTASYTNIIGEDSERAGLLLLHDAIAHAGASMARMYKQGDRQYVLIEIYPTGKGGARSVTASRREDGLVQLDVHEKTQRLSMLHNQCGTEVEWVSPVDLAHATLHPQGEVCRLSFLPAMQGSAASPMEDRVRLKTGEQAVVRIA
jgi:hypothetical protein